MLKRLLAGLVLGAVLGAVVAAVLVQGLGIGSFADSGAAYAYLSAAAAGVLTGVIAGGLWRLNREPVYGYFALCAPFGILRYADRLWETPPVGWPLWGGIMGMALVIHLLLLTRFALAMVGCDGVLVRCDDVSGEYDRALLRYNNVSGGGDFLGVVACLLQQPVQLRQIFRREHQTRFVRLKRGARGELLTDCR